LKKLTFAAHQKISSEGSKRANVLLMIAPRCGGGYRFGDYWRPGLPLEVLIILVATPMLFYVWPLNP